MAAGDVVERWASVWRKLPAGKDAAAARRAVLAGAAERGQTIECCAGLLRSIFGPPPAEAAE